MMDTTTATTVELDARDLAVTTEPDDWGLVALVLGNPDQAQARIVGTPADVRARVMGMVAALDRAEANGGMLEAPYTVVRAPEDGHRPI